jgi:alcohol dehydrogenase class IV
MSEIYHFHTVPKLVYGQGSISRLAEEAGEMGKKVLLITGSTSLQKCGITAGIKRLFSEANMAYFIFDQVKPEPELELVEEARKIVREEKCDLVIGIGGGSVLDVAKATAGLANSPDSVYDYFQGKSIEEKGIPFLAIPTVAGAGAEVTPNSVLTDKKNRIKKSIRGPYFMAERVLVDPELMVSLPPEVTASSGMDALVQGIEAFTSKHASFLTDTLSLKGIELIGNNIKKAYRNGKDIAAREAMAYGSLVIGMAFSNCRLGAVHGLAHPVGALYGARHGIVCGVLMPSVMYFNLPVAVNKYAQIARILGTDDSKETNLETAQKLIRYIEQLLSDLNMPKKLNKLGLKEEDIPELARQSMPSGSLKANPREVEYEDLVELLKSHL